MKKGVISKPTFSRSSTKGFSDYGCLDGLVEGQDSFKSVTVNTQFANNEICGESRNKPNNLFKWSDED